VLAGTQTLFESGEDFLTGDRLDATAEPTIADARGRTVQAAMTRGRLPSTACWPASRSERHHGNFRMASGEALDVFEVTARNDCLFEFEGCRDHECVDGISGGHASRGKERARTLGDGSRQLDYSDGVATEELVYRHVKAAATTDLSEYRRRDPYESTALVGNASNRART
jgi:hypothetical protein